MINSNNQELIHHIHCFGCMFYHQSKTKNSCWFQKFLLYGLILYLPIICSYIWSLLWILFIEYLKCFLFIETSLYSLWLIVATTFYSPLFVFLYSLLSSTKYKHIFGFNPKNSPIATPAVSSFILPTPNLFELS